MSSQLHAFESVRRCPKCNTSLFPSSSSDYVPSIVRNGVSLTFCTGRPLTCFADIYTDHFHVACVNCGYTWIESCADAARKTE